MSFSSLIFGRIYFVVVDLFIFHFFLKIHNTVISPDIIGVQTGYRKLREPRVYLRGLPEIFCLGLESTETSSQPPFSKMVMKTYCAPPSSLSFFVGGILAFFYWPLMTISSFVSFLSPSRFFIVSSFMTQRTGAVLNECKINGVHVKALFVPFFHPV